MAQVRHRWAEFIARQRKRLVGHIKRFDQAFSPEDPFVAVIRREGIISKGRYIMHFNVTLFGNNPVVLEEFGRVRNRDNEACPRFSERLEVPIGNYQYFVEIRQHFKSIEHARDFWTATGATSYWDE